MPNRNPFRAALDGMVNARQRQANRYVADFLLQLDDAALKRTGYSRAQLREGKVRADPTS